MGQALNPFLDKIREILSPEQRRFVKFCVVGASGVPINLLFTWIGFAFLFVAMATDERTACASLLGIAVSILTNFLLNDLWTWADRDKTLRGFWGRLGRFYIVSALAATVQFSVAMVMTKMLLVHYLVAQLCGIAFAMVLNYVANNFWTFRQTNATDA